MSRLDRKYAVPAKSLMGDALKNMGLSSGMNTHLIRAAWNEVSQARKYTLRQFFRDGKLYVTLSSSVARSGLQPRLETIREQINTRLVTDPLFTKGDTVGYVEEIVLK